jgi:Flp pilus assembly protein protease CpaA
MKQSSKADILVIIGIVCVFAGNSQRPLGLPGWAAVLAPVIGGLFALTGVWLRRRPSASATSPAVALTLQQYKKRFWLLLAIAIVASLTTPFYLRYTGIGLSLSQLVICSIVSCAVCVTVVILSMRRHRPKV